MSKTQVPPGFGDEPRISLDSAITPWLLQVEAVRLERPYNGYFCGTCGDGSMTYDLHPGVTPMLMACFATDGCRGQARSLGYPPEQPPADGAAPTMEWYRPSTAEYVTLPPAMRDHVDRGGLAHRRVARPIHLGFDGSKDAARIALTGGP
jgi:hypothetical protein